MTRREADMRAMREVREERQTGARKNVEDREGASAGRMRQSELVRPIRFPGFHFFPPFPFTFPIQMHTQERKRQERKEKRSAGKAEKQEQSQQ